MKARVGILSHVVVSIAEGLCMTISFAIVADTPEAVVHTDDT